jgi:hypothetical protein
METLALLLIGVIIGIILEAHLVKKDVLKFKTLNEYLKTQVEGLEKEVIYLFKKLSEQDEIIKGEMDGIDGQDYEPPKRLGNVKYVWRFHDKTHVDLTCGHTMIYAASKYNYISLSDTINCTMCNQLEDKINGKN